MDRSANSPRGVDLGPTGEGESQRTARAKRCPASTNTCSSPHGPRRRVLLSLRRTAGRGRVTCGRAPSPALGWLTGHAWAPGSPPSAADDAVRGEVRQLRPRPRLTVRCRVVLIGDRSVPARGTDSHRSLPASASRQLTPTAEARQLWGGNYRTSGRLTNYHSREAARRRVAFAQARARRAWRRQQF